MGIAHREKLILLLVGNAHPSLLPSRQKILYLGADKLDDRAQIDISKNYQSLSNIGF
ncbi:hypothetical protein IQ264_01100 [Phormidium sp. LEGE 05292]|uniref:hypothetical protein n=1 Tax=[Phormidium] sp. LEGE 05292 TaxID=767427 RepID=UPI0018822BCC|nr:hypothetical protein [Phormidium sp. LEGE 05292]MBE9224069.1 hypothetical protein [Phormidium sp. LEGE 05292]